MQAYCYWERPAGCGNGSAGLRSVLVCMLTEQHCIPTSSTTTQKQVVDAQSKRAKLSDRDIDIYHVESNEPLALDALRRMIKGLFATAASQADERVLMGLVQQVRMDGGGGGGGCRERGLC